MFTASCRSCTKTGFPNDTINSRNGRISPSAVDMSTCIRYKISNRLKVDNAAFCKPSDINPITGNPIYRDFFTHSGEYISVEMYCTTLIPDFWKHFRNAF